jgi:glycosyltransferase involved in cell wall biosynthesis
VATVYNGIDLGHFRFEPNGGDYLAFVGRISPDKRVDRAIEVARDVGMRLLIAAKVDSRRKLLQARDRTLITDRLWWNSSAKWTDAERTPGGAYASLFPIDWPEPFGLTMVESMATGTPVIAYRAGSVPEIIEHGVTGFVCDSVRSMVDAVPKIAGLDRRACRQHVEKRFSLAPRHQLREVYATVVGGMRRGWSLRSTMEQNVQQA